MQIQAEFAQCFRKLAFDKHQVKLLSRFSSSLSLFWNALLIHDTTETLVKSLTSLRRSSTPLVSRLKSSEYAFVQFLFAIGCVLSSNVVVHSVSLCDYLLVSA